MQSHHRLCYRARFCHGLDLFRTANDPENGLEWQGKVFLELPLYRHLIAVSRRHRKPPDQSHRPIFRSDSGGFPVLPADYSVAASNVAASFTVRESFHAP